MIYSLLLLKLLKSLEIVAENHVDLDVDRRTELSR